MFSHMLVPLDGSEYALRALSHAEGLAKLTGARLTLIGVLLRDPRPEATHVGRLDEQSRERLLSELNATADEVRTRAGLEQVDAEVRFGQPAQEITDYADSNDVDLVVMSTHGLGATGRYALGSVALKVLMTVDCPVFMVRIPSHGPSTA